MKQFTATTTASEPAAADGLLEILSKGILTLSSALPRHRALGGVLGTIGACGLSAAQVGTTFCPGVSNSTGTGVALTGTGSIVLSANELRLTASGLPQDSFGHILASLGQAAPTTPAGSMGALCLSGAVGSRVGGVVLNSGTSGQVSTVADLTALPQPGGAVPVQAGETWHFQYWYRDIEPTSGATSNLSDALEVEFLGGGGPAVPGLMPIPPGSFSMGSPMPGNLPLGPVHQVTITQPYWLGRYEVTQTEFQAVMGVNPSLMPGAERPVETLTWQMARDYCAALTAMHAASLPAGYQYRLPTEAEWEYACRAQTTSEYFPGSVLLCDQACFTYSASEQVNCGNSGSVPVGGYLPNAFGLHDMHGNVWEWCLDSALPYSALAVSDPFVTGGPTRVIRGGSWGSMSTHCRSANRHGFLPNDTTPNVGFRVALGPIVIP